MAHFDILARFEVSGSYWIEDEIGGFPPCAYYSLQMPNFTTLSPVFAEFKLQEMVTDKQIHALIGIEKILSA